jgi:hypothetical protein
MAGEITEKELDDTDPGFAALQAVKDHEATKGATTTPAADLAEQQEPEPIDTTIDAAPADETLDTAARCWQYATTEGRQHFIAMIGPEAIWKAMTYEQKQIVIEIENADVEKWEPGHAQVS